MNVSLAFGTAAHINALQDLSLQRSAQTFHGLQLVLPGLVLQFLKRGDPELLVYFSAFSGRSP
jgi:hypothetical protein